MENNSEVQAPDYGTPAEARGYAMEISYAIAHPEEEEMSIEQVASAREELRRIKAYLAGCDEPIY